MNSKLTGEFSAINIVGRNKITFGYPGTSDMYHTRRQTKASGNSCFLAEFFGRNGPSKLGAVIRRLYRHVYYLPSRFVWSLSIERDPFLWQLWV